MNLAPIEDHDMTSDSEWNEILESEQTLLRRCKKFVLGSPDSPGGGSKDILYFTPCGRWLRVCSRIAYYSDDDAGEGELSFQINSGKGWTAPQILVQP